MTYLQILTDICSRVADPDLDTYKERAKDHFLRALTTMVTSGEYIDSDIRGYIKLKTDLTFSTNPYNASALKILKISEIMPNPQTPNNYSVYYKEFEDLKLVSQVAKLQPEATEVFIFMVGISMYAVYKATGSNFVPATATLYMKYVEIIDSSGWVDATVIDGTPYWISTNFIRRGIEIASKTLLDEVNL